jgi:hypothetical protein
MNHFYLESHSKFCNNEFGRDWCASSPCTFLFFANNTFVMVTYHKCIEHGSHIDLKLEIISAALKNSNVKDYYTRKSVHIDNHFKEVRLRNIELNIKLEQINFLYEDNALKKFCITTETPLLEAMQNNDLIISNADKMIESLKGTSFEYQIENVKQLRDYNLQQTSVSDIEFHKTTNHLIKNINKKIRENDTN